MCHQKPLIFFFGNTCLGYILTKKYYKAIITKFRNLFLCSLDHSVLVIAERLRIIAIEFLTVVLEKDGEDQFDRCVKNEVLHRVKEERNHTK
jgi:hypothetical protein